MDPCRPTAECLGEGGHRDTGVDECPTLLGEGAPLIVTDVAGARPGTGSWGTGSVEQREMLDLDGRRLAPAGETRVASWTGLPSTLEGGADGLPGAAELVSDLIESESLRAALSDVVWVRNGLVAPAVVGDVVAADREAT